MLAPAVSPQSRIASIQGIRGIAMSLVFFYHYAGLFAGPVSSWGVPLAFLVAASRVGTDLFLVISGFGVYASVMRKPVRYTEFLRRRAFRIYPPFLFMLSVYVAASLLLPGESKLPHGALAAAAHVAGNIALIPLAFGLPAIISVSWTLAFIMAFYAAIPLVVAGARLRQWKPPMRTAAVAAGAALWFSLCWDGSPYVRAGMFLVGMLVYEVRSLLPEKLPVDRGEWWLLAPAFAIAAIAGVYMLASGAGPEALDIAVFARRTALVAPALLAFGLVAFGAQSRTGRLCSHGLFQGLGAMSYSYYLAHGITLRAVGILLAQFGVSTAASPFLFWAGMPFAYALTLAGTAALFVAVERPLIARAAAARGASTNAAQAPA
ncbi:MAG: acyltransferase family protein [bacterium]|jgi:exopolysaccharide production protein ExoZ